MGKSLSDSHALSTTLIFFLISDFSREARSQCRLRPKAKLAVDGKVETTDRRLALDNGHRGLSIGKAAIRRGESPYTKCYQAQGEQLVPVSSMRLQ